MADIYLKTRAGQGLATPVYVDRDTTGATVTVEYGSTSKFTTAWLTKTPTASGRKVDLALSVSEVETIKDSYFRINVTKDGLTSVALSGRIDYLPAPSAIPTSRDLPVHAGTRVHRFDPAASIYNATAENLRPLRAAMGRAQAAVGLTRITFMGDSLTVGYPGIPGTDDPVSLLARRLTGLGLSVGNLIHVYNNQPSDPRITFAGTWASRGGTDFPYAFTTAAGATLTVTGKGVAFEVVSNGTSGAWTVSIDGAAPVTFTGSGSNVPETMVVTGLTNGDHTAVITTPAVWSGFHSVGFRPNVGFVVENAGISGATTAAWLTTNNGFGPAEVLLAPGFPDHNIVFLELGANNWAASTGVDSYGAQLTELAQRITNSGAALILGASHNSQTADPSSWLPYLKKAYDVADTLNVPLIDFANLLGVYAERSALGLVADATHLTPAGNGMKAAAYFSLLTS